MVCNPYAHCFVYKATLFTFSQELFLISILFIRSTPPTALSGEVRYEKMMEMFGETGHLCRTVEEIETAVKKSIAVTDKPSIINILIDPSSNRKPQAFNWLTESKL